MRRFLDTSALVWLYDTSHAANHEAARAVLRSGDELVVSTNVLGELFVALTKKRGTKAPLATIGEAAKRVRAVAALEVVPVRKEEVLRAVELREHHQVSWWDALNWASAASAGCDEFVGADRPSRPKIDGVRFVNPFVSPHVS